MRLLLLSSMAVGTAALLATATAVSAADLRARPVKAPEKAPVVAPVPVWHGLYFGVQAGHAWGKLTETEFDTDGGPPTGFVKSWDADGIVGGGHAGFNYQAGSFLFGIEGDVEGSGVDGRYTLSNGNGTDFSQRWQASLRGRVGAVFGSALIYATGGAAWSDLKTRHFSPDGSLPGDFFEELRTGWTVGGGVEWMFAPAWSARIEYRHTDFGRWTNVEPASFEGQDYDIEAKFHTVRVGVSYRFGAPPPVARP